MKKYLIFSIIADILLIVLLKKYIFISNISTIPTFLFVFSLFMGILYVCCKDDTLSFHIAPYTDEKNGTKNNKYISKSYFISAPIYFLLIFFFNNVVKICLSFLALFGTIIGYILFTILNSKRKSENDRQTKE